MKINLRFSIACTVLIIGSLLISGCAFSHSARGISLRTDRQLYPQLTDPITVTLSSNYVPSDQYRLIQYQITDNGQEIAAGTITGDTHEIDPEIPFPHTFGPHSISARARFYNSETDHSDWSPSSPAMVCIFVGSDPPDTYSCNVYGFPEHLEAVTVTPDILVIATETPIIIVRPDNSSNGAHGGKSGSGCGQYASQSSCNLAGCSWTGSACQVNP